MILLAAFITGASLLAMYLEKYNKVVQMISGASFLYLLGFAAASLKIVPQFSAVSDFQFAILLPVSVSLFLFKADLRRVWRVSGRLSLVFLMTCAFTFIGGLIAVLLLRGSVPEVSKASAIITGAYTGGVPNFFSVKEIVGISDGNWFSLLISDSVFLIIGIFIVFVLPSVGFVTKRYVRVYGDDSGKNEIASADEEIDASEIAEGDIFTDFEGKIPFINLGISLFIAIAVTGASYTLAGYIGTLGLNGIAGNLLTEPLVLIPLIMTILATVFSDFFSRIKGDDTLAMFITYTYIFSTGGMITVTDVLNMNPMFFMVSFIIFAVNILGTFGAGKILKIPFEELVLSVAASFLGQYAAFTICSQRKWHKYAVPGVLIGLLGIVVGNYFGISIHEIALSTGLDVIK
jgi:uncharacterized membrane protein